MDHLEIPQPTIKETLAGIFAKLPEKVRTQSQTLGRLRTDIYRGCASEIAYNGLLGEWSFDRVKTYLTGAGAWNVPDQDPSFTSGLSIWEAEGTSEFPQYDKLLQHLSKQRDETPLKRTQLSSIATDVGRSIDRSTIIHSLCQDLAAQLNLHIDDEFIEQYSKNIKYESGFPKADTFLNRNIVALATPDHLSPDCLLSEEHLADDIAFIKHEFVHFLRLKGKIKYDIAVPIASAITALEFLRGSKSHVGWNPSTESMNNVREIIMAGTDIEDIYCQALLISERHWPTSREKILVRLTQSQDNEPAYTYAQGSRLGVLAYLLEESAKKHGIDFTADSMLARLAQGELPGDIVGTDLLQQLKGV